MHEQAVCRTVPEPAVLSLVRKWLGMTPLRGEDACYPRWLYVATGAVVGVSGVILSWLGNPPNTGYCVSCFLENIAGSLGLHSNIRMQYLRPEIMGFVIGAFLMSLRGREFRAAGGSSPLLRFFIGMLLIVGCAVFIGCPIKMVFRLAAGDLTALVGAGGLVAGVAVGMQFLARGFTLGRPAPVAAANALLMPLFMVLLLAALLLRPGFIAISTKGAGAQYAPLLLSLLAGLGAGALAQRTGFCVTGGISRLVMWGPREFTFCPKTTGLAIGMTSFFLFALAASVLTGQFSFGWQGQPSSNDSVLWNFLAMTMVGFGSVLIRGCPFRQLVVSGQGDTDAGMAVLGMLVGAALVQDWGLSGNAEGTTYSGKVAVLLGLSFLVLVGIAFRKRGESFAPEFQSGLD